MRFKTTLTRRTIRTYTSQGYWRGLTLNTYLDRAVARHPDKVAIVDPKGRVTYAELGRMVERLALGFLALGIQKGDVVTVQLPNWAEFVFIHLALTRIGAVTNPLLPIYRHRELTYMTGLAESVAIVIPAEFRRYDYPQMLADIRGDLPKLKYAFVVGGTARPGMMPFAEFMATPWEEKFPKGHLGQFQFDGNDVTLLQFTSGTVANKGLMHTHNTMLFGNEAVARILGLSADDVVFMPSPLGHATGFEWGMRIAIFLGAKLVLQDIWDPQEACRLIAQEGCTYTLGATPFVHELVNVPDVKRYDLRHFRYFACAGSPIPRELGREALDKLGILLLGAYGMTEHFVSTIARPGDPPEKLWGTDGRPLDGVEVEVFDDARERILPAGEMGELACRGPNVGVGYFCDPQRTRETFRKDGWQFSEDYATKDEAGFIRIVGRKKDMIIRGGINISPTEIEDILYTHPKVFQAAIVAMPDQRLGEKACAYIVPRRGEIFTFEEMVAFLKEKKVATYKLPERLELVDELPMTPSGKVRKNVLREDIARKLGLRPLIK